MIQSLIRRKLCHDFRTLGAMNKQAAWAAVLALGQVKELEEGTKPQQGTRARLAEALGAPKLEQFGEGA
jgi:hypothetical protein